MVNRRLTSVVRNQPFQSGASVLLHAFDKLFLMVTFGSSDLCLCFFVALYTQYVRRCVQVQNANVLLMNLSSESITIKKNGTHDLNYISLP